MCSKPNNTSNTYNDDLCSIVANFVAVGYVLAEMELLLLLLLPLLLSDAATLVENNDTNDINDPHCIQGEGNPLEKGLEVPALSGYVGFFPSSSLLFFLFSGPPTLLQSVSFSDFLWSLYFAQPLFLLFLFSM